jgi:hypothetical protein
METESWRSALPDNLQASPSLQKMDSLAAMAASYIELEAYQGSSIRVPGEHASAGDVTAFRQKLMDKVPSLIQKPTSDDVDETNMFWKSMGKPELATEYDAIEGMSDVQSTRMRDAALGANLTQEQYRSMAGSLTGTMADEAKQAAFDNKTKMDALHEEWGVATPNIIAQIKLVSGQLDMPEGMTGSIDGPNANADALRFMKTIVDKLGMEGGQLQQQLGDNGQMVKTPAQAEAEIAEIMNDPDYWRMSPRQEFLKQKINELSVYAAGNTAAVG